MDSLTIDLTNPAAIRKALPRVRREVTRREQAVMEARAEYDHWALLHATLRQLAGPDEDTTDDDVTPSPDDFTESGLGLGSAVGSAQTRAVQIVKERGEPTTVATVAQLMPDVKRKTVGWALWNAVREDALAKVGQGLYAPLDFVPGQERLAASPNGADPAAEESG